MQTEYKISPDTKLFIDALAYLNKFFENMSEGVSRLAGIEDDEEFIGKHVFEKFSDLEAITAKALSLSVVANMNEDVTTI